MPSVSGRVGPVCRQALGGRPWGDRPGQHAHLQAGAHACGRQPPREQAGTGVRCVGGGPDSYPGSCPSAEQRLSTSLLHTGTVPQALGDTQAAPGGDTERERHLGAFLPSRPTPAASRVPPELSADPELSEGTLGPAAGLLSAPPDLHPPQDSVGTQPWAHPLRGQGLGGGTSAGTRRLRSWGRVGRPTSSPRGHFFSVLDPTARLSPLPDPSAPRAPRPGLASPPASALGREGGGA